MEVTLTKASQSQESILSHLLELYNYDVSEFEGSDVGEDGLYGYPYLPRYWIEPGRKAFLVRVDGALAGFALVNEHCYLPSNNRARSIAEFFIMRKYRCRGVGEAVARQVFDFLPGEWQVAQIPENTPAQAFWRKVIGRYTGGNFREIVLDNENWRGPVQLFDNSGIKQENA